MNSAPLSAQHSKSGGISENPEAACAARLMAEEMSRIARRAARINWQCEAEKCHSEILPFTRRSESFGWG